MPRRLLTLCVLLGLTGGCADSHTTEVESARGTVDALLATCAADRPQDALEVLNPPARQAFLRAGDARAGCRELLGLGLRGTRITGVRTGDLSAKVDLQAPSGEGATLELEKSRGVWYVAHPARSGLPKSGLSAR